MADQGRLKSCANDMYGLSASKGMMTQNKATNTETFRKEVEDRVNGGDSIVYGDTSACMLKTKEGTLYWIRNNE